MNIIISGLSNNSYIYQSNCDEEHLLSIDTICSTLSPNININTCQIYINNQYIDPWDFHSSFDSIPTLLSILQHTNDINIQIIPKLIGGKGGFGNNLRGAAANKKRLPIDESSMRNLQGQRLGSQRDRELLLQYEQDLRERERADGRGVNNRFIRVRDSTNNNNNNNTTTTTTSQLTQPLNSHTAISRLQGIPDSQIIHNANNTTTTASQLVNENFSLQDALNRAQNNLSKSTPIPSPPTTTTTGTTSSTTTTSNDLPPNLMKPLADAVLSSAIQASTTILPSTSTTTQTNNPTLSLSTLSRFTQTKKASSYDCGLDLPDSSDDDDEDDDDEDDE